MKKLFLLCLLCSFGSSLSASHVFGVDLRYECLSSCTLRLHVTGYVGCSFWQWLNPDNMVTIGATGPNCQGPQALSPWIFQDTVNVFPTCTPNSCSFGNDVDAVHYYRDYDFCNLNCTDYTMAFDGFFRTFNPNTNLDINQRLYDTLAIDLSLNCNSTPTWCSDPVILCATRDTTVMTVAAFDPDGDSLVYTLETCYEASGDTTEYLPGYSPSLPLGANWQVDLNAQTGLLQIIPTPGDESFRPTICMAVNEYRNGQWISRSVRDVQLWMLNDTINRSPNSFPPQVIMGGYSVGWDVYICAGDSLCLDLPFSDPDAPDSVRAWWLQTLPGGQFFNPAVPSQMDTIIGVAPTARICWRPTTQGRYDICYKFQDTYCDQNFFGLHGTRQVRIHVGPGLQVAATASDSCGVVSFAAAPGTGGFSYQWSGPGGLSSNPNSQNAALTHTYTQSGWYHYQVNISDSSGCYGTIQDSIFVEAADSAWVTQSNDSLFAHPPGLAWQWYLNGVPIPGATGSVHVATQSGGYAVQLTDSMGCQDLSDTVSVMIVGLDAAFGGDLRVYPNPFREQLIVEGLQGESMIELLDMQGRVLYQTNAQAAEVILDVSEVPAGMYFLRAGTQVVRVLRQE